MTTQSIGERAAVLNAAITLRRAARVREACGINKSPADYYALPYEQRWKSGSEHGRVTRQDVGVANEYLASPAGQVEMALILRIDYPALVRGMIQRVLPNIPVNDLEELERDVYLRALECRDQFNPELSRFSTWIANIAKSVAVDKAKYDTAYKRPYLVSAGLFEMLDDFGGSEVPYYDALVDVDDEECYEPSAEECAAQRQEAERALAWIAELPKQQRRAAELVIIQGLSYAEAAQVLDLTTETVKYYLKLVRRKLRGDTPESQETSYNRV